MKSKLLYLLLWAVFPVFSQGKLPYTTPKEIEINTAFATQMNAAFANLDKSRVPNGLLQDFAMEYTSLEAYSGSLSDSTFVHPGVMKQLYSTLLMSRVNSNTSQGFVSYSNFENNWNNERNVNTITLSGLYFKYSKFLDNAYPDKITVSNNKLYDKFVNGVWQNPYEQKKVFAISPSLINYKGLNFTVKLPSNLWYTNNSTSVQSIQINFNDGNGYVNVNPGQQVSINYSTPGIKLWTYKMSLSTGETLLSHSKLNFEDVPNHCAFGNSGGGQCIETLEITSSKTYQGVAGKATLQINYGNVYGEIRKPLIVAEGLDLGAVTSPEFPFGESSLVDFLRNSFNSESGDLIALLNGSGDFYDHDQEYDIIYVNWNDGTDFIQRNAYALEAVIAWVNDQKTTTEENVVIGQSMGGLVARYALKEMEDDPSLSHETRLFVSQDSPHLGANIPLGYQYAVRNGRNQYVQSPFQLLGGDVVLPLFNNGVGVSDYLGVLDEPAVKQMLIQWVDRGYAIDNTVHESWQTTLKNKGYPQQTRNVAISNGSQCAITQGFNPGANLFGVDGRIKTGWLTDIFTSFTKVGFIANAATFLATTIFTFEPGFLFGVLPGNSKLTADIDIKALPNFGQTNQIYAANVTFTKKVLWLININVNIIDESFNSPSNTLPYDYYPGGVVSTSIPSSTISNSNALYGLDINITSDPDFVLVPTVSALDIGKGFTNLNDSDYLDTYRASSPPISPKDSPFVNFITSFSETPFVIETLEVDGNGIDITNFNQFHLELFEINGDWLANEIENIVATNVVDCTFLCSAVAINGNANLCSSGSYSIQTGVNVQWSASPSSLVNISNNSNSSITLTPATISSRGKVTLTATITSPQCDSKIVTKEIYVGKPDANLPQAPIICTNQFMTDPYTLPASEGAETYRLVSSSPYLQIDGQSEFTYTNAPASVYFTANQAGFYLVELFTTNSCGTSRGAMYVTAENCGGIGFENYAVYPNPASEEVFIEDVSKRENNASTQGATYSQQTRQGKLYDFSGILVKTVPLHARAAITRMEVSNLKPGLYFLKIQVRDEEEVYKIIVAH